MATPQVRRVRFAFDGDVPFLWNPENPEFCLQSNAVSVIAIAFEKYIVAAVREAIPRIRNPEVAEEADVFLRQEAQHARAHREHLRALARRYPGLTGTYDEALACYDERLATKSLRYHLAYIADLEAAFTPIFKIYLDHADRLFRPGDDRVASLFLWHFTEEVEHRSSGLRIYREFGGEAYRMSVLPSLFGHLNRLLTVIARGFNAHVPFAERQVDATTLVPLAAVRAGLREKLSRRGAPPAEPSTGGIDFVPRAERLAAVRRILRAQLPNHDPEHQPLPAFADEWRRQYEAGAPVGSWYAANPAE